MQENKKLLICFVGVFVLAFGAGRFSAQRSYEEETKTQEVVKQDVVKSSNTDRDQHVDTTTTTTKLPDGSVTTVVHTTKDTDTKRSTDQNSKTDVNQTIATAKSASSGAGGLTISGLIGVDITKPLAGYVGGASVTVPFIGPSTIGLWGLSNGVCGLAVGIHF